MSLVLIILTLFFNFVASSPPQLSRDFYFSEKVPDVEINAGEDFDLYVRTSDGGDILANDDWKTCTWTRRSDRKKCKYNYICEGVFCQMGAGDWKVTKYCDYELNDVLFFGDIPDEANTLCGVKVQHSGLEDHGDWTVSVEECQLTGCWEPHGNGIIIKYTVQVTVN